MALKTCILYILCSTVAFAQAFDPDCYFPTIGNGIDTIYGSNHEQALGSDLRIIPPGPERSNNRIIMHGLPPLIPFHSMIEDIPNIDIHSFTKPTEKKKFNIDLSVYDHVKFGHFRDTKHTDMLVGSQYFYIYWADDKGDYDSARRTLLSGSFKGDLGGGTGALFFQPYAAFLTSDTTLDIIAGYLTNWNLPHDSFDSVWILFWRGGQDLYNKGGIATQDSALFIDTLASKKIFFNAIYQGDFRGIGREDLIVVDDSNSWLYYRNDPPFSLHKFYNAILFDTLLSAFENTQYGYIPNRNVGQGFIHNFRVIAKPEWDRSEDIVVRLPTLGDPTDRNQKIFIFRGGPNFGTARLTLKSATDTIYDPYHYDNFFNYRSWGDNIRLIGDMTGTGNPVIHTTAGNSAYYVMGKALDDKIDMFVDGFAEYAMGSAIGDVIGIHANKDQYTDVLKSFPRALTEKDWMKEWQDVGSIHLINGSNKIPVRLNPKYSGVESKKLQETSLLTFPNPCINKTTLTFDNCSSGKMYMEVVNTLGKIMLREEIVDADGLQQYSADLSMLVPGAYHIRLVCPADGWSATTTVVKL